MLAPDGIIAGQRKHERSFGVESEHRFTLDADGTDLGFFRVVTREHLGQAFEIDRILLGQCVAGVGEECRRIDTNG